MPPEDEFDRPIYKVLAANDTGAARGHQGGFVVPKDLENFFPLLSRDTSSKQPTVDRNITADLFDGSIFLETVETRYQYQTWKGERSPERRITGNITSLRNRASGDDVLIIQRGIVNEDHYRFTLIRKTDLSYDKLMESFRGKRWGVVYRNDPPADEIAVERADTEISEREGGEFFMFDAEAGFSESRIRKISRSRAFQRRVRAAYGSQCAICQGGLLHPKGMCEADAAHIVSRSIRGSDDTRNGILLCKAHHWAFDFGMIGINDDYTVIIPKPVEAIPQNVSLSGFSKKVISLPVMQHLWPSKDALAWHRDNLLLKGN